MPFNLLDSDVYIWFCRPEAVRDEEKLTGYKAVLSIQEKQRYHRFRSDSDRHSYLVSHALLRHSLSKHRQSKQVGVAAGDWRFSSNAHGKPELIQGAGYPALRFNLTHTAGLCACVVTLNKACGIDAENVNRSNNLAAVAQRMFAAEELKALRESSYAHQFYNFWTLREAYVKALGSGLAGSSKNFYFSVNARNTSNAKEMSAGDLAADVVTARINFRQEQLTPSSHWQFRLFEPTLEHKISIAFETGILEPEELELAKPAHIHITEYVP